MHPFFFDRKQKCDHQYCYEDSKWAKSCDLKQFLSKNFCGPSVPLKFLLFCQKIEKTFYI